MEHEALKLVIVGAVDHGKSTLIGRLLHDTGSLPEGKIEEIAAASKEAGREMEFAFVTDHLREERARGLTIDTAQVFFSTAQRDYAVIDTPGHREFLKNMVTGASQADAAVLICGAYESVEEQTRRHTYVLKLLGLRRPIVVYNKMDLVGYDRRRFEEVREDLHAFLGRIDVQPGEEIPVSAKLGDNVARRSGNMPWYEGPTVLEALDMREKGAAPTGKPVRLPIQDAYDVDGRRIAVGRVESGVLTPGAELVFLPAGCRRRVLDIFQFQRPDMPEAACGECVGVHLDPEGAARGDVGCAPDHPARATRVVQASVFWLAQQPLRLDEALVLRCSTQEKACKIAVIHARVDSSTLEHLDHEAGVLAEAEVGEVTLHADAPVVVERFTDVPELGRFVLLRGGDVVAGGIVSVVM